MFFLLTIDQICTLRQMEDNDQDQVSYAEMLWYRQKTVLLANH